MLSEQFTLGDDFPPVDYDAWRALVEADLKGAPFEKRLVTHTFEGIDVQPLYTRRDRPAIDDPEGFPGLPPFVRGATGLDGAISGWDLRQEHAHPDIAATNQAILADLHGGATSVLIRFDDAARVGFDPGEADAEELVARHGLAAYGVDDLAHALAGVDLAKFSVALDAGAAFLPAAAALVALWRRCNLPLSQARGAFHADPLAYLASTGSLPGGVERQLTLLADLASWTAEHVPRATAIRVDSSPYHHAGATAAQDIAFAAATGLEYLRATTDAGMTVDAAARQTVFSFSLGTHHFLAIAKLRAARKVWARILGASGGSVDAGAMRIHARTSERVLTQRDPHVNLLRNTTAAFAAAIGGAETFTSLPFDHLVGLPQNVSRRIARNTALIVREEAHLLRVVDPAGGSWFLDQLTDELATCAWGVLQETERAGGMRQALASGWVGEQIDAAYAPRLKDIARRKEGITGVSEFPNVSEERVVRPPPDIPALRAAAKTRIAPARAMELPASASKTAAVVDAVEAGASFGAVCRALGFRTEASTVAPLEARSFAEPFEALRDAADAHEAEHGRRPRVFLANMGSPAHYTARATFAKNFFEAGGFEVLGDGAYQEPESAAEAFAAAGAKIAVICSSDVKYPDLVPDLAQRLKAAGARCVVVAGAPGELEAAWRSAGVDRFIFMKCDVLATLREMLQEEGVLSA